MLLVGVQLGVNEVFEVVLIVGAQACDGARRFAVAGADVAGPGVGERAVIACTLPEPVEPLSAVGLCAGPLAYDGPLVGSRELGTESTGRGDVLRGAHGNLRWGEDLVLMSVEKHILVARRGLGHDAVPIGLETLESVMDAGGEVAAGSCHGLVA